MKVACVVWGEMGHIIPMSQLAEGLLQRGHEVYFVTNSDIYNEGKVSRQINAIEGLNLVQTDDPITREEFMAKPKDAKDVPDVVQFPRWEPFAEKALREINPDIVVGDFYTRVGIIIADRMKIPSVIQCPGIIDFLDDYGVAGIINLKRGQACCGMICVKDTCKHCAIKGLTKWQSK